MTDGVKKTAAPLTQSSPASTHLKFWSSMSAFYLQKTPSGMGNSPCLKLPKMPQIRFHSYTFLPLFPFSCWPAFELFSSGQGAQTWCAELFLWAPPRSASWLTVCRKVFWQPSHAELLTTLRTSNVVQKTELWEDCTVSIFSHCSKLPLQLQLPS
jgi:hypothetical protein